jgi:HNH endonuclease
MTTIDPTAQVEDGAVIGEDTVIGPYCMIGPHVVIGKNCKLIGQVSVMGHTSIGDDCLISPFAGLGGAPQDLSYRGEPTRLHRPDIHRWYKTRSWLRRRRHQLRIAPLCQICLDAGQIEPATIADHIEPHKGDYRAFRLGRLRSLCKRCHDALDRTRLTGSMYAALSREASTKMG